MPTDDIDPIQDAKAARERSLAREEEERRNLRAFPISAEEFFDRGMLLRDYFAAAAMRGLLANRDFHAFDPEGDEMQDDLLATNAYQIADAMLAARKK